jgi:hypothetical protein
LNDQHPTEYQLITAPKVVGQLLALVMATETRRVPTVEEINEAVATAVGRIQGNRRARTGVSEADLLAFVRSVCADAVTRIDTLLEGGAA